VNEVSEAHIMQNRTRFRVVATISGLLALTGTSLAGAAAPATAAHLPTPAAPVTTAAVPDDKPPYEEYPVPARPALPGVGNTFVDPTFGTEIMQITGPGSTHAYAYWPTFNKNSTRLYIFRENDDTAAFYDFDPVTFKLGQRTTETAFERTCSFEDAIWSGVDPNVIHCHDLVGTLYAYNVATNVLTPIKDLGVPAEFQMTRSIDDQVFGWRLKDDIEGDFVGWVTYDRTTDTVQTRIDGNIDEIQLDKTGRYILEGKSEFSGADGIQTTVIDRVTGQRTDLTNGAPDFAPGHGDVGTRTVLGHDDWNNQLRARNLANPKVHWPVLQWDNFRQDYHGSLITDDESWMLLSAYGTLTGPLASEVFLVQTDGCQAQVDPCGTVRHVAHTFSSELPTEYYHTPRAAISRDGRFATYVSDWGTGTTNYVFVARIT
jgi:hypothetical protein